MITPNRVAVCLSIAMLCLPLLAWQSTSPSPPAKPALPPPLAEDVFNNIQLLKGAPAESVIPTMEQIRHTIGVDCAYCHVPHDWANDDKKPKQTTRQMFGMLGFIKSTYFDRQPKVSCWTCHRGQNSPAKLVLDDAVVARVAKIVDIPDADKQKPAEQVFKNIQVFKGVPAGQVATAMAGISTSLGVRCTLCHNGDDYASDEKDAKKTARDMIRMRTEVSAKFATPGNPIGCFTCHHGHQTPEIEEGKLVE
jgi:nitrate/TMAO reductase-like tetraheme cytochrome c subunit